ncbi:enoyl-CoA hydratase-related protein [Kitasatospora sp. NBC_00085]|uniref:enoyl-CoA hydratase-related protein n=1 Tax=unclassified Kitasatospora TaxID=2633591 RepID=UPI002F91A9CD
MELTTPATGGPRTLRLERDRGRLTVTLTRPAERNSITRELITELGAALDLAEEAEDCRVVVLRAEGDTFCSGMDLSGVAEAARPDAADTRQGGDDYFALLERLTTIGRIVVAQVDGQAVGGGVGLAAASDFVHATGRSRFSLPEALWGLLPCSVLPFLIRRVGFQRAYAMSLGTLPVTAAEAAAHGLVDELADDPAPALRRLLFRASKLPPGTVADLKSYMRRLWILDDGTQRTAVDEFVRLMTTGQVRERIAGYTAGTGPAAPPPR